MSGLYGEQIGSADIPDNIVPVLIGQRGEADQFSFSPPAPEDAIASLPHEVVMSATLMRIEHELRRLRFSTPMLGRQEIRLDQGNTDPGDGSFITSIEGPRSGADWYVERISCQIGGNSLTAFLRCHQGSGAAPATVEGSMFIDGIQGFQGAAAPSAVFQTLSPNTPYYIQGGQPLVVSSRGGGALGVPWYVRIQMREVLGQSDPLLQNQGRY